MKNSKVKVIAALVAAFTMVFTQFSFGAELLAAAPEETNVPGAEQNVEKTGSWEVISDTDGNSIRSKYKYSDGTYAVGWVTIDGEEFYFGQDNKLVTGRQTIEKDGTKIDCYIHEYGGLVKSAVTPDGFLSDDKGNKVRAKEAGWVTVNDKYDNGYIYKKIYYLYADSKAPTGWVDLTINNVKNTYFIWPWMGRAESEVVTVDATDTHGFLVNENGIKCDKANHEYKIDVIFDGDTEPYYTKTFRTDANGKVKLGWADGNAYYTDDHEGIIKNGIVDIQKDEKDNPLYGTYVDSNGKPDKTPGWKKDVKDIYGDKATFYVNNEGNAPIGEFEVDGKWYFEFEPSALWCGITMGEIGENGYLYDENGYKVNDRTGWITFINKYGDKVTYYLGNNYMPYKGKKNIDGIDYTFDNESGQLTSHEMPNPGDPKHPEGWYKEKDEYDNDVSYYYDKNGAKPLGWHNLKNEKGEGPFWYYISDYRGRLEGEVVLEHYRDKTGFLVDNNGIKVCEANHEYKIPVYFEGDDEPAYTKTFKTNSEGKVEVGWIGNEDYYVDITEGILKVHVADHQGDGKTGYGTYVGENGKPDRTPGWKKNVINRYGDKVTFYVDKDGKAPIYEFKVGSKEYFAYEDSGILICRKSPWGYLYDDTGAKVTGKTGWVSYKDQLGDEYYFYLDNNGKTYIGEHEIDGTKYIFEDWSGRLSEPERPNPNPNPNPNPDPVGPGPGPGPAPVEPQEPADKPVIEDVKGNVETAPGTTETTGKAEVTDKVVDKLVDEAINSKTDEVQIKVDFDKNVDNVEVELPKDSLADIAEKTDAELNIKTPAGSVKLNKETIKVVVEASEDTTVQIVINKKAQKEEVAEKLGKDAVTTDVKVVSGNTEIHTFGGNTITVVLPVPEKLSGLALAVVHIDAKNRFEKMAAKLVTIDGKQFMEFETTHFSDFAVAEEKTVDEAIEVQIAERNERIKNGVKNTTLKLKSAVNGKSVSLTWQKSKGYKVDGYEVYRSAERYSGYQQFFTPKNPRYKNTKNLKKGSRYYYKVRGYRFVDGKKVYTKWSNKAYRTIR